MSSDAVKKRKPKVIRNEVGTPETKRGRAESEQVTYPAGHHLIGQRKLFTAKNQDVRVYNEEVELEGRDPQQDYMLYKDTCAALAKLMDEIQELKAGGEKVGSVEIEERRRQCSVHFITLKKLNRLAHMRLKKGRDQTHEAKQRVDVLHLQLQNLLYEVMHLQKEIGKCLEFKSQHEEIELVSEEEFFQEAPPEISRPDVTPHACPPGLGIGTEEEKQAEVARHLPPPLYVLLVQAGAYGQACDKNLSVSISGDVDEAKALSRPPEDSQDDESDSDAEEEQQNTTKVSTTTDLSGAISAGELLNSESLLNCLYASDHGKETPNPANRYQFDKVGITTFADYLSDLGHPYVWVQKLGGLQFSSDGAQELGFVQHVLKARLVSRLLAAVVVNPRYPEVTPLFSLSLHWKGERSGRTDDNLRAMESEVNVFRSELQGPRPGLQLLTNQIQRLCVCLDVYLETESQVSDGSEGPKEFPREKMCLRTARGPSRLKPFKYNHPQGFFSHR
ncbi:hypothetical protein H4Q32_018743 [Labeo rohita]|uniref:THO complex subunit 5-like protein n=1 Tax=Labeo rohita TaxID=84645 RepID=A0ABQ8LE75_LABRO|nr:hypothetical protein H4Q32_018743 [Labeo rohita]